MKKMIAVLLAGCLLLLTGCSMFPSPQEVWPELFTTVPEMPEVTEPPATLPPETEPQETESPETTAPTEPEPTEKITEAPTTPSRFPYIVQVDDANTPIYSGPGYHYSYEGTVKIAARYTIMEEKWDSYGNLWGRLKSGAGWIVLNEYFEPYLVYVSDPNKPIYDGPGYGYDCVGTVKIAAQYTIVEEQYDYNGNLWGRLKSGAGWICLSWY